MRTLQLLSLLADGRFHSGKKLGEKLGISRASVFNALECVEEHGVELQRIRGRGYCLQRPWDQLQKDEVLRLLDKDAAGFNLEILQQAASSNSVLLKHAALGAISGSVVAVELQTEGRGRRGRTWHSGWGSTLTFSILWRFDCGLNALSGLSLAMGVAVVRAICRLGTQQDIKLKWPNDILTERGKLGGILIEAQGDMLGPSAVIIGIGINCTLQANLKQKIDQPASSLDEICTVKPSRNQLLAVVLQESALVLHQYTNGGFSTLRSEWEKYHIYQNQEIQLQISEDAIIRGIARGVSNNGELRMETAQGLRIFSSGEVGNRQ